MAIFSLSVVFNDLDFKMAWNIVIVFCNVVEMLLLFFYPIVRIAE